MNGLLALARHACLPGQPHKREQPSRRSVHGQLEVKSEVVEASGIRRVDQAVDSLQRKERHGGRNHQGRGEADENTDVAVLAFEGRATDDGACALLLAGPGCPGGALPWRPAPRPPAVVLALSLLGRTETLLVPAGRCEVLRPGGAAHDLVVGGRQLLEALGGAGVVTLHVGVLGLGQPSEALPHVRLAGATLNTEQAVGVANSRPSQAL
mmetsp:Transcript_81922/g.258469  ORF Transcript_81922/g.258469 Transcript_81922/m.258469 type:complete len:210 (+) Transcript_81922:32-661(+)